MANPATLIVFLLEPQTEHYDAICTYISWRECVMVLASVLAACDWWDGILFLDILRTEHVSSNSAVAW